MKNEDRALTLINKRADVDVIDPYRESALTLACDNRMSEVALALIYNGATYREENLSKLDEKTRQAIELHSNMESFTLNDYSLLPSSTQQIVRTMAELRTLNPVLRLLPNELLQEIFKNL